MLQDYNGLLLPQLRLYTLWRVLGKEDAHERLHTGLVPHPDLNIRLTVVPRQYDRPTAQRATPIPRVPRRRRLSETVIDLSPHKTVVVTVGVVGLKAVPLTSMRGWTSP